MRLSEFVEECNNRLIDPKIAVENEKVADAARTAIREPSEENDERVLRLLDEEF